MCNPIYEIPVSQIVESFTSAQAFFRFVWISLTPDLGLTEIVVVILVTPHTEIFRGFNLAIAATLISFHLCTMDTAVEQEALK